ncbi:MAG: thiamine-phosphate kinase [Actinomycetales bacterium]
MLESELLEQIRALFGSSDSSLVVENGDDGAVYIPKGKQVVTTDVAVETVHFRCDWSSYFQIGQKITAANLADIYAMGGIPKYLLVALVLPTRHVHGALELAKGILDEAKKVGATVIGGDLARGENLSISITAIGEVEKPFLRSGAKVGDRILISSLPGAAAAGLELLSTGGEISGDLAKLVVSEYQAPTIEYQKYQGAIGKFNSAIDTSDGLLSECAHISKASKVRFELKSELIRKSPLQNLNPNKYFDWILYGGEDHKLLGTCEVALEGFIEIGSVVPGNGVFLDGTEISTEGFEHRWPG